MREHHQRYMAVEAGPESTFVVVQAELTLRILIEALNDPAQDRPATSSCRGSELGTSANQPLLSWLMASSFNTFTGGAISTNCLSTTADLAAEDIASIDVVKGLEAINRFGERARGGVVVITTVDSGR